MVKVRGKEVTYLEKGNLAVSELFNFQVVMLEWRQKPAFVEAACGSKH